MAITFVVTPILVAKLGDEGYGIWSIVMSFATYYSLVDLGLQSAATKYIAQFHAVEDWESANKVVVTSLAVCLILAVVVLLLVGLVAAIFPFVFNTAETEPKTVCWVVVLTGASVAVTFCGRVFVSMLLAAKRFDVWNVVEVSTQVFLAVLVVTAVNCGGGLLAMAWIVLLVACIRQLCVYLVARRVLEQFSLSPRFFDRTTLRTQFRFGSLSAVFGMAKRVTQSAGVIIVGAVLGPAMVTFYAIAESLANKSVELSHGIRSVLLPVASQLDAQDRRDDLIKTFLLTYRTLFGLALGVATVFVVLGVPLIDLWIGPGYSSRAYPVLCVLSAAVVVRMPSVSMRSFLKGTNYVGTLAAIGLIDVVLTLTLGAILVPVAGIMGMASAVLFSQAITAGVLVPGFTCRILGVSPGQVVGRALIPGAAAAVPAMAAGWGVASYALPTHLVQVIVLAIGLGLVTGIGVFFVCLEKQLRIDVLRSFLGERMSAQTAKESATDNTRTSRR